ncbi:MULTISPECIES: hypothetical protein [Enterococcus]|uniref:hypothetical protein n=1 Tax=Enterococcus TaxID=1350 RepID=UPI00164313BF|nr:hypothetical protein [Enterococcus casseliflavus]MDB1687202.1 hypothetical protein [Enterococcus casseliflavus]
MSTNYQNISPIQNLFFLPIKNGAFKTLIQQQWNRFSNFWIKRKASKGFSPLLAADTL